NFEAPTLNPFWNFTYTQAGSIIFPSTSQAHSGKQSVQFNSNNSNYKDIEIGHNFSSPTFGTFSVWVYDSGAQQVSSNSIHFECHNTQLGTGIGIRTYDYDLGPNDNNGGSYYIDSSSHTSGWVNTGIVRSSGWHRFSIMAGPGQITCSID